nr:MAG TPA: hypothetical protein [Caudoviricetes sp.]
MVYRNPCTLCTKLKTLEVVRFIGYTGRYTGKMTYVPF